MWTKEKTNELSDVDFAVAVLREKRNKLSNPNSPLALKLEKTIKALESIDETFSYGNITASISDTGGYSGIRTEIISPNGESSLAVVVENYPDKSIHAHVYSKDSDEPIFSAKID